jgi:hypothetical protein
MSQNFQGQGVSGQGSGVRGREKGSGDLISITLFLLTTGHLGCVEGTVNSALVQARTFWTCFLLRGYTRTRRRKGSCSKRRGRQLPLRVSPISQPTEIHWVNL